MNMENYWYSRTFHWVYFSWCLLPSEAHSHFSRKRRFRHVHVFLSSKYTLLFVRSLHILNFPALRFSFVLFCSLWVRIVILTNHENTTNKYGQPKSNDIITYSFCVRVSIQFEYPINNNKHHNSNSMVVYGSEKVVDLKNWIVPQTGYGSVCVLYGNNT